MKISKNTPLFLIIAGTVLLLLAAIMGIYSLAGDYLAGRRANLVLEQTRKNADFAAFTDEIKNDPISNGKSLAPLPTKPTPMESAQPEADSAAFADEVEIDLVPREEPEAPIPPEPIPVEPTSVDPVQPEPKYDVLGVLTIPQLRLELPVLSECTGRLLKISVCRYIGNAGDKPKRLVVAGHNYKSHFGNLPKLGLGDEVYFTNYDGIKYSYIVSEITEISGDDHAGLRQGEWDITLLTCNSDGSRRILIRCQEVRL